MRRPMVQGVFIVHRFKDLKGLKDLKTLIAGTWTFLLQKSSLTYKFGAYWVVWSVFKFWNLPGAQIANPNPCLFVLLEQVIA